jgi:hypothetical protein
MAKPATSSTSMMLSTYQGTMPTIKRLIMIKYIGHWFVIHYTLIDHILQQAYQLQTIFFVRAQMSLHSYKEWFLLCSDMIIHDPDLSCYAVKEAEME